MLLTSISIFKYREDRLPVLCICAVFAIDVLVYLFANTALLLSLWMLLSLLPKIFYAAWNHHHQHCNTFHQSFFNRVLEVIYTFHTGITTNVWVLHHNLGHHLHYLEQSKDESGWMREDGTQMGVLEYTLKIGITGYVRAFGVGRNYPKFQKGFIQMAY